MPARRLSFATSMEQSQGDRAVKASGDLQDIQDDAAMSGRSSAAMSMTTGLQLTKRSDWQPHDFEES